jgi:folate-dependent tRNA-U54 methylase TrmFO/GidA
MEELETEQQFNVKRDTQTMWRVLGTLTHRMKLSHALSSEVLRKMPGLENLSLFRRDVFQQGTNFRATPAEGAVLLRLAEAEHV